MKALLRPVVAALAALALSLSLPAQAQVETPSLSTEDRAAVRCSAAFAIVAGEQARGGALDYPPLAHRGREFFVATGAALTAKGWTQAQVGAAMNAAAAELQADASAGDPAATLAAVMPPCLSLLDTAVPPLATPTLAQCAAILQLSYEEIEASEGLSGRAKDMKTLANVLAARHRKALTEGGATNAEADRAIALARDAMLVEASSPGGIGKYDINTCFDLAKPDEKTHY